MWAGALTAALVELGAGSLLLTNTQMGRETEAERFRDGDGMRMRKFYTTGII